MRRNFGLLTALLVAGLAVGGIVPENAPIPPSGQAGAPHRVLTPAEQTQFLRGRLAFDKDFRFPIRCYRIE